MDKQILKTKLKHQAKSLAWRAITTVILTMTAVITVWVYAAFVEPAVGPNDAGWDQDFLQNILGADNNNNDFSSSSVVANNDGSIIERLESIASTTVAIECGNGVIELGEGCDDGNTSWTSGTCAGDCSGRNYWSQPHIGGNYIYGGYYGRDRWCEEHGFKTALSFSTVTRDNSEMVRFGKESVGGAVYWYNDTAIRTAIEQIWCGD